MYETVEYLDRDLRDKRWMIQPPIQITKKNWKQMIVTLMIRDAFKNNVETNKKLRCSQCDGIDKTLLRWFKEKRSQGIPITEPILQAKANDFGKLLGLENYECSESWIKRFRNRHNIVGGTVCGESASVSNSTTEELLKNVFAEISKNYTDEQIFNADETGLFYKMTPNKTLKSKAEKCSGGKMSKDRITVLVVANMTDTIKKKLLVIGKSNNPRSFKSVKRLPVDYRSNRRTWMVSEIFEKFLRDWYKELCAAKKKILLLVDNCSAHPNVLQPLDQGIRRNLKVHFGKALVVKMIENADANNEIKINILDTDMMISTAWNAVSQDTIVNCLRHAGFLSSVAIQEEDHFEDEDNIPLAQLIREVYVVDTGSNVTFDDFVDVHKDLATCGELNYEDLVMNSKGLQTGEEAYEIDEDQDDREMEFEPTGEEAYEIDEDQDDREMEFEPSIGGFSISAHLHVYPKLISLLLCLT
ncbi:Tc5 transposase DNA-binding domain [Popillia japonica]|uniref:Tc5 transposase DNA-binding domain n=1 Tax=Popillia japonica TaxID=7064 RepID=A0AAW1MIG5_POPJA